MCQSLVHSLYKHSEHPNKLLFTDSTRQTELVMHHRTWLGYLSHVMFDYCISFLCNRMNALNKEMFCTILVGYLIILFNEVILKKQIVSIDMCMPCWIQSNRKQRKKQNKMKTCQLIEDLSVDRAISPATNSYYQQQPWPVIMIDILIPLFT